MNLNFGDSLTEARTHLVGLRGLVEHAGVDGCSHQVVGSCDGVNVTSQMEVELQPSKNPINKKRLFFPHIKTQPLWGAEPYLFHWNDLRVAASCSAT